MAKAKAYSDFTDLEYEPGKSDLVVEFKVEPNRVSFSTAAEAVAGESTIGTWTEVSTSNERIKRTLAPKIFYSNPKTRVIKIAYPIDLFELGNVPQLMSSVAGNVFGMKIVKGLRLEDIDFPDSYIKSFKGPRFGIRGVRKLFREPKRPLCGTIVKPKLGLTWKEHAKVAFEAWVGGVDLVKDDENLSSQKFNNYEKRLRETLKMRDRAESITGEKKCYMPNVTAETREMLRRAELAKNEGSEYIMVDVLTSGYSALQTLRQEDFGMVLHAHRAMHGAITRNRKHGISMLALAKTYRLIGLDQLHIGTIVGKMEGGKKEVKFIDQEIERKVIRENLSGHVLSEDWLGVKPMFAVCSGGLHPGHVPSLVKNLGKDIIIQAGGGIHGHPSGTVAGAKAMRQAIDAVMSGRTLKEHAKGNAELAAVLKKWKK